MKYFYNLFVAFIKQRSVNRVMREVNYLPMANFDILFYDFNDIIFEQMCQMQIYVMLMRRRHDVASEAKTGADDMSIVKNSILLFCMA